MPSTIYTTRKEALKNKEKFYYPTTICTKCGTSQNYTSCYKCVQCKKNKEREYRSNNPETMKVISTNETKRNAKAYRRRYDEYITRKGTEYMYELRRSYRQNNMGRIIDCVNKRRAQKLNATPKWYDPDECSIFYDQARSLYEHTGIVYQVDHIIPLIHDLVCGLHCADNLQVITAKKNRRKSNTFD